VNGSSFGNTFFVWENTIYNSGLKSHAKKGFPQELPFARQSGTSTPGVVSRSYQLGSTSPEQLPLFRFAKWRKQGGHSFTKTHGSLLIQMSYKNSEATRTDHSC
jgi:hypothetical protein